MVYSELHAMPERDRDRQARITNTITALGHAGFDRGNERRSLL